MKHGLVSRILNVLLDLSWAKHHYMQAHNETAHELLWRNPELERSLGGMQEHSCWIIMRYGKLYRVNWPEGESVQEILKRRPA